MPGAAGGGAEYHLAGGVAGGVEELEAGRAALRFFPPYFGAGGPRILIAALFSIRTIAARAASATRSGGPVTINARSPIEARNLTEAWQQKASLI